MKKAIFLTFFLAMVLTFSLIPIVCAQEVLLDFQNTQTTNVGLRRVHPSSDDLPSAVSQSINFTESTPYRPTNITFLLQKNSVPTGYLIAGLYNHTGVFGGSGLPTGPALVNSTAFDLSTIGLGIAWYNFTFSEEYWMQPNTIYCLVLLVKNGTVDNSNYIRVFYNATSSSHEGNDGYFRNSVWIPFVGDLAFRLYGEQYNPPPPQEPTDTILFLLIALILGWIPFGFAMKYMPKEYRQPLGILMVGITAIILLVTFLTVIFSGVI